MSVRNTLIRTGFVGVLAIALTSCGGSGSTDTTEQPAPADGEKAASDETAAASSLTELLPEDIRSDNQIVWGVEPTFPPSSMMNDDNTDFIGVSPDMARAVSEALGVKPDIRQAAFDSLIPGIQAGRFDLVISQVADTKEREKSVDFVDYAQDGTKVYVKNGNPDAESIKSIDDLCGKSVALLASSVQVPLAAEQSKKCVDAGEKAFDTHTFPDNAATMLALSSGRVAAVLQNVSYGDYIINQQPGQFEGVGDIIAPFNVGIVVKKGNTQLVDAVKAALEKAKEDGSYQAVFDTYGLADMAIDEIVVNEPSF